MPVVAQSPPIIYGGAGTNTNTPKPTRTPRPARTPKPAGTPVIQPGQGSAEFVSRHQQFVDRVDQIGTCFKREALPEFSDPDFNDHIQVAMQDKSVVQSNDSFCSMKAVSKLVDALRRTTSEQEII